MTKKNYLAAAKIVLKTEKRSRLAVAEAFVLLFSPDNQLFDTQRFLRACGIDEDEL
jgi:hypothetical protein